MKDFVVRVMHYPAAHGAGVTLAALVLAVAFATPAVAELDIPAEPCSGDSHHSSHQFSQTACEYLSNPHFSWLPWGVTCEQAESGQLDCIGCDTCCDGEYYETLACTCGDLGPGSELCVDIAKSSQNACRGNCIAAYVGTGCPGDSIPG